MKFIHTIAVGVVLVFTLASRAELPPSVYEEKQNNAAEFLTIQVLRVEIEPTEEPGQQRINAVALVTKVNRTATDLKPEAIINISYIINERPKNFVGPGEIPILEDGQTTIAFLAKNADNATYQPVAGVMSFSQF